MAQPPKLAIATRPSIPCNIDAQRRETKSCITKLAIANASSSAALVKQQFRKPEVPARKINGFKCQYCDKNFVKNHGMTTHLLEKCEKIPASVRRQLLQKQESCNSAICKNVIPLNKRQEIDFISKYSRFFAIVTNESASGMQGDDVEKGLKDLRAEVRKIKSGHTGIIRTPNKPLRCHICKKQFLDCVEYALHSSSHAQISA